MPKEKQGLWRHLLYSRWDAMMARCHNPYDHAYANYGGRGIRVCKRWHEFTSFLADVEDTYRPGLELYRILNGRGYSPKNCRWMTEAEQSRNRHFVKFVELHGHRLTVRQWISELDLKYGTLWVRVKAGWRPTSASTTRGLGQHAADRLSRFRAVEGRARH
jgi:hypothetical protein